MTLETGKRGVRSPDKTDKFVVVVVRAYIDTSKKKNEI